MAATKTVNIRVTPERKAALLGLADAFGESLTEFVLRSVLLRVRHESPAEGGEDPFVLALRRAAKGRSPLTREEKKALAASRAARARGLKMLSVAEAGERIRREMGKREGRP